MTISTQKIEELLSKFYDGQTSEAEEQMLRQHFASPCCDKSLEGERRLFLALDAAASQPHGLSHRLERDIDRWASIEHAAARHTRRSLARWTAAAAVALAVAAGATALWPGQDGGTDGGGTPTARRDTYDDPRDAYAETQRALLLFSNSINKGIDQAAGGGSRSNGE